MNEERHLVMYFTHKADAITNAFIMAINGAFFTTRSAGYNPTPHQIELAKQNVASARYVYVNGISNLVTEIVDRAERDGLSFNPLQAEVITRQLHEMAYEMTLQANKAISFGHNNKAAKLLAKSAHGAMGELVQQKLMKVELIVRSNGKRWSEPASAVSFAVHQFASGIFDEEKRSNV